ncbi:mRNA turnover protein 4 [Myriangium duriaei CBS 260.36]|uniref:Ribosome assembly factor mrt4 n=1 Tax=Myriangium duriaei CBS 260.36 TaxID=1168546 RepID=A0A9P4J844_9PEZI|nr:mRNA turnover protein 4 [Myriangium duriaei CBS 260.36]
MPKSKRQKVVHLTAVKKKDKEAKEQLFSSVQDAADNFSRVFVFSVAHMRNTFLKDVRTQLSDSRIFFGKTKVMAKALGLTVEQEHAPGLAKLAKHIDGSVGLLFTDREAQDVIRFFEDYTELDFARAGVQATRDVIVPAGVVYSRVGEVPAEEDTPVPHSLEVTIRKWGMPTKLEKGRVLLDQEWQLCKEGETLNSHQTALLKLFGIAMVEFQIKIRAYWDKKDEDVTVVEDDEVMEEG